jgi:DNA-binding PadR family transcriptional regulator
MNAMAMGTMYVTGNSCPICLLEDNREKDDPNAFHWEFDNSSEPHVYDCSCPLCGKFVVSSDLMTAKSIQERLGNKTHLLSGALRNLSEKGAKGRIIGLEDAERLVESAPQSETVLQKRDRLLLFLGSKAQDFATLIEVQNTDFPIIYLRNPQELYRLTDFLERSGCIQPVGRKANNRCFHIDEKGWEEIEQLRHSMPSSDQAFVAMWFHPETDSAFKDGFQPGIRDTGYDARRIDTRESNNKICEEIIAEIRRSAFVVADFTGNRGGVYFEAGFALGLGIPVIWTCQEDHMGELHFDTRQYNHIVWKSPVDLRKKLKTRIEATMPIRAVRKPT